MKTLNGDSGQRGGMVVVGMLRWGGRGASGTIVVWRSIRWARVPPKVIPTTGSSGLSG